MKESSRKYKKSKKATNLPKIIVVLGPTAVGKSDIAVKLAQKFKGEVVSADSRQVYRGLNIGTGKITKKEMLGIPHHLLDVTEPKKIYSVSKFQQHAYEAINDILNRGKTPILCGGTGLYIQSIVDGTILPEVEPNPALRKKLENKTSEQLFSILKKLDPVRSNNIDAHNPVRLIRAIEISKAIGKVPRVIEEPKYTLLQIGLDLPTPILHKKITDRIGARIKKGMITEAKRLHTKRLTYKRMYALGLEYRFLAELLQRKITTKEFSSLLNIAINQYVKRQRQWFKRDARIEWFKPTEYSKIEKAAKKFLSN